MKLDGRRESTNVDDRRRGGTTKKASIGIGGIVIAAIIAYVSSGGDWGQVATAVVSQAQQSQTTEVSSNGYEPTAEEEELASFTKKILAGTEDVWTEEFEKMGKTYEAPGLVLFHGDVTSACGQANSSTGPFYCSGDQKVYIDLEFFTTMKQQFGADGDFCYAYVIAHEVGHHVQYLLGTLTTAHQMMSNLSETESNKVSVRLELQADFYAGVWANHDNAKYSSLEEGDIDEGLAIAAKIGDDYLQKQAYGYTVPESFNHGTSDQRSRWLKKGVTRGNMSEGYALIDPNGNMKLSESDF